MSETRRCSASAISRSLAYVSSGTLTAMVLFAMLATLRLRCLHVNPQRKHSCHLPPRGKRKALIAEGLPGESVDSYPLSV